MNVDKFYLMFGNNKRRDLCLLFIIWLYIYIYIYVYFYNLKEISLIGRATVLHTEG